MSYVHFSGSCAAQHPLQRTRCKIMGMGKEPYSLVKETYNHNGCRLALLWDAQYVKNMCGCSDITIEWYLSPSQKVHEYSPEVLTPGTLK